MKTLAEDFRDQLVADLANRVADQPALAGFIDTLAALDCMAARMPDELRVPDTVPRHLDRLLSGLDCGVELASTLARLARLPNWYQIYNGVGLDLTLAHGLIGMQVAGQAGLVQSKAIRSGLFLIGPGVRYPLHQHEAQEFYYVVSGRLTVQHGLDAAPFHVGSGEVSITPSNRVHELRTEDGPVLITYAWIGDVDGANWWWERRDDGSWERICWKRQPDARWVEVARLPATDQEIALAGRL